MAVTVNTIVSGGGSGGGGGSTTFAGLTDASTANLPGINAPLGKQLGLNPAVMGANVIDITNDANVKTGVVAPQTYTFSAAPSTNATLFGLLITVTTAGLFTFPSFYSDLTQTTRTTLYLGVGEWYLQFRYDGTQVVLYNEPGIIHNLVGTVDPTVSNDGTQGYGAGSIWINGASTPPRIFNAISTSTGAAVWVQLGYVGIPIQSISAAYTAILGDQGTCFYHPAADTTARTWTIPANASVAFPLGTTLMFDNEFGAGSLTIAITTDTLRLVGAAGTTGSRTLAAGGRATAVKVTSTLWRISGTAELT